MDALAELLDGVRARGALFGRAVLGAPWSLRFSLDVPLVLVAMLQDTAWVTPGGATPMRLGQRDLAVVRGSRPFVVADAPAAAPLHTVTAADFCIPTAVAEDARSCVVDGGGSAVLVGGAYEGTVSERLLGALPDVLVVPDAESVLDLVAREVAREDPGQQVVLDRLFDLALVSALRAWFERPDAHAPAWYRALHDPVVGRALRLLHDDLATPWTIEGLASQVGVSRAALARRFTERVGEPPMTYLASRRIDRAAELLRGTDQTVGAIARRVGYANVYALSVAFKRLRGVTPTEHRRAG